MNSIGPAFAAILPSFSEELDDIAITKMIADLDAHQIELISMKIAAVIPQKLKSMLKYYHFSKEKS